MLNLSTNQILITNVSAIESSKGIDLIVEALAKLKSQYKLANFHFYHIGGLRSGALTDSFYEEQKQRIQDFGLTEHFTWIGIRTDVLDILPAFDIYIQPSRMEGLPVSVMEACSAGLPCIGSDISGIPEIIHNGENGYVIEQEDVDQLAFHLNELIEDETRRLEMGGHSKEIFAQNFDINTQVARTKQYYEELITR
jgi:glycosyltransferase involved in cell wall biosynthesis